MGGVYIADLLLDKQGNLFFSGSFSSPGVTLGGTALVTRQLTGWGNAPGSDVVVAKYTEAGSFVWAVQGDASGNNAANGRALAYDGQGHLYVGGAFSSRTMRLGTFTLANASSQMPQPVPGPPTPYTENYYSDAYVARLDAATGAWQWASRQGGQYEDAADGLVLDGSGRLLVQYVSNGPPPPAIVLYK